MGEETPFRIKQFERHTESSQVPHPTQEVTFMAVGEPDHTESCQIIQASSEAPSPSFESAGHGHSLGPAVGSEQNIKNI